MKRIDLTQKARPKSWKTDLVLRGQRDPVWWITNILGDKLWSKQEEICRSVMENERTVCAASFGVGKCFDTLTQILTESRGWQFFKDLLPTDKVASLVNGTLQFVLPEEHFEGDFDGEMIGCRSKQLDFLVTPNHRCLVATGNQSFDLCGDWHIEEAQDIYGDRVYFNKEIVWEGIEDSWTEQHYELWGFWFADGSINGPDQIFITQKNHIEYAVELMSVYKVPNIYDKGNGGKILSIGSRPLVNWFINNFGRNKDSRRVPNWIKQATRRKQRAFIRGFFHADGSYIDRYGESYGPTPAVSIYYEDLAEDIAEVAMKAGFGVTIRRSVKQYSDQQYGGARQVTCWIVSLLKNNTHLTGGRRNWYTERYKGKIYCVKVPSGIILVRRNGLYHWSGNTFLAARLALWFLCTFKPAKVISTGPTLRQVRDLLWKELRTAHQKAKVPLGGELLQLSLQFNDEHFAMGFSTDETNIDRFTGYHSPNQLVIFDQAAGIPTPIWEAAEGLMTSDNCRWLAISNTTISDSEMANICMPDRKTRFGKWNIIKIRASESPNVVAGRNIYPGLIAHDWVKKREESWGKDDPLYKIFVEAEFVPSAQMSVIQYRYIIAAFENEGEIGTSVELGVDVARQGLDSTVFVARSGSRVLEINRLTGNNTMEVVGALVEFKRSVEARYELPVSAIKIDIIGLGAGVYDRCMELDIESPLPVVGVNNAESPTSDKERYLNLRAEQAWAFRRRMEQQQVGLKDIVVNDFEILSYLRQDMTAMKYKISSNGKIQLWAKEDLRLEIGRSPDYWDALVMSFETPGGVPGVDFIAGREDRIVDKVMTDEEWARFIGMDVDIDDPSFLLLHE